MPNDLDQEPLNPEGFLDAYWGSDPDTQTVIAYPFGDTPAEIVRVVLDNADVEVPPKLREQDIRDLAARLNAPLAGAVRITYRHPWRSTLSAIAAAAAVGFAAGRRSC